MRMVDSSCLDGVIRESEVVVIAGVEDLLVDALVNGSCDLELLNLGNVRRQRRECVAS